MKYLIALLLITNLSFSQKWSKTELTDFASIEFPSTPEKTNSDGVTYYSTSDDIGVYMVMIKDLGNPRITKSGLPKFYQGVISGALKSVNGELLEKNEFESNGIKGIEILYTANSNSQLPDLRHKRIIVADNYVISYEFWTFKENEQLSLINKDKFLNSISITTEKGIEPEKKETNSAYESGFAVGQIVFYLLIIGLIIGGILLIRNRNRKKNKNVG
ncbi:hypothetical protein EV196_107242 [Mariniflexile fucanivorans]|uniref:Uncharacterized protein n=1 Tax=Mariniflexile fucanivorans TaxID=264023 RepID=A0A4R1RF27_9FLAO|nr:hypothetical protein [Mariniflexile fucanivorans]TCL64531.1 hypothetical protein EV196_107242 [Mariniflexile fucanivorans]